MGKIILSPLVTSMRGKIGNGVFFVWKGIQCVKQVAPVITNPNSNAQQAVRALMTEARRIWLGLSGPVKNQWLEMANLVGEYPLPPGGVNNIVPKLGGKQSAFNCYVGFYMRAVAAGFAAPTIPPLAEERPNAPTNVAVNFATPNATVTWTDPLTIEAGGFLLLWLRSPKIYHRQYSTTLALGIETVDLTGARAGGGTTIPFTTIEATGSERLSVQMCSINPSGLISLGSNVAGDTIE